MNITDNLKIYTIYHDNDLYKRHNLFESDIIKPINIKNVINDENDPLIKHNIQLSEFATQLYIWKNNVKSKYVGFQHYGKQFSLTKVFKYGTEQYKINEEIKQYNCDDILCLSCYYDSHIFKNINNTLYEEDYKILENYIKNNYNGFYDKFKNLNSTGNDELFLRFECFVCKWEYFDEYMKFICGLFKEFGLDLLNDDNEYVCSCIDKLSNGNTFIIKEYLGQHFYNKRRKIAYFVEYICGLYWYLTSHKIIQNYIFLK